jgi:hypothetical protein
MVLRLLVEDGRFDPSGKFTNFIQASYEEENNVGNVKVLLVWLIVVLVPAICMRILSFACSNDSLDIVRTILADPRVDPAKAFIEQNDW